jgi:hypothetical protein
LKKRHKGGIKVTGRQRRRRWTLLDDLKERRGYSHLKEEALDRTLWRARFGRGFGPVVRQTAKWMNVFIGCFEALIKRTVELLLWKYTSKPHLKLLMKIPFFVRQSTNLTNENWSIQFIILIQFKYSIPAKPTFFQSESLYIFPLLRSVCSRLNIAILMLQLLYYSNLLFNSETWLHTKFLS